MDNSTLVFRGAAHVLPRWIHKARPFLVVMRPNGSKNPLEIILQQSFSFMANQSHGGFSSQRDASAGHNSCGFALGHVKFNLGTIP